MINFSKYITEDKGGKNLHLEHIEDEILNFGVPGGRAAINFVRSLRDMLAGASRSSVNMTVKWDGDPAIFAGEDPSDGKFFVAKKSVFNQNPLLYKSVKEISDASELNSALPMPDWRVSTFVFCLKHLQQPHLRQKLIPEPSKLLIN